jgi:GntR family transcriptional regulator, vanillate catabolism transcriptional regulator
MQKFQKVKHSDGYDLEKSEFGMQSEDVEAGADTQLERATEALRELVLRGAFPVDEKLPEAKVAELLGVSRTPARLAMAVLEQDGLLVRLPRRGFRVRSFSLDEVVEAIEVRGEIEAIAARLVAERGLKPQFRTRLEACIGRAEVILKNPVLEAAQRRDWCQMNLDFHDALIAAAGVRPLISAFAKVNLVPLASPRDTMFNVVRPELTRRQLEAAHADHTHILDAILARQSTRAAGLVREHAYRSGENKRRNFPDIQMRTMVVETPGVALVRADPMPV